MGHTHTVIIVDDEAIIRDGLSDMVDWEGLGYEVVGCFADGRDAIEYLAQHYVDVVLTDIKMDDLGGIEIARYVHEQRPEIRVVIVSGYQDFGFARDAIRYHAASYLLKPIDFEELQSVFSELKRELTPAHHENHDQSISTHQFASDIVAGRVVDRTDLARHAERLDVSLDIDSTPAALLLVDFETKSAETIDLSVRDGIIGVLRRRCHVSLFEPALSLNSKIVVLAVDSDTPGADQLMSKIRDQLAAAVRSIRSAFQVRVATSILACEGSLGDLVAGHPASRVQEALSEHRHVERLTQTADHDPVLRRVVAYLEENYASDLSVADASALAFLSPVYFGQVFRDRMGVTFTEYLASVRVAKAIELLRTQRYKVQEIGKLVGYRNARYFARVFKKATGFSPREYCTAVLARELQK